MIRLSALARILAALIAFIIIASLAVQFNASLVQKGSAAAALWSMVRFFTIIGSSLGCLCLLGAAVGLPLFSRPSVLGGVTLITGLIGSVYATVLRNVQQLTGDALLASQLLHYLTPILIGSYWLLFVPKGGLTRADPLRWALLPLAYLPYALARARQDGRYPYPFLNVDQLGAVQVALNCATIAMGFLLVGLLMVWLDRALAGRRAAASVD